MTPGLESPIRVPPLEPRPMISSSRPAISLLALLVVSTAATAEIRFVDRDAPQNGNGLAWGSAYRSLRGALNEAQGNPDIT